MNMQDLVCSGREAMELINGFPVHDLQQVIIPDYHTPPRCGSTNLDNHSTSSQDGSSLHFRHIDSDINGAEAMIISDQATPNSGQAVVISDQVTPENGQAMLLSQQITPERDSCSPLSQSQGFADHSFTSSVQLIDSNTSTNVKPVKPHFKKTNEELHIKIEKPIFSPGGTSIPNIVHKVVVIQPSDDPDKVTQKAIAEITADLNRQAAEKLAKGETPNEETVIEITRIRTPADKYIPKEQPKIVVEQLRETVQGKQTAFYAPPTCKKRKAFSARKYSFRTPSPPPFTYGRRSKEKGDLSSGCYFNGRPSSCAPIMTSDDVGGIQSREEWTPTSSPIFHRSVSIEDMSKHNMSLTDIQWLGRKEDDYSHKDLRVFVSNTQIDKISQECGRNKRPPYSYMHLIQMAICSQPDRKMTLREIYKWIEDRFPYYKYRSNQGWKNSIRHNLSLYDIFVREKKSEPGQTSGSYWSIRPEAISKTTRSLRGISQFNCKEVADTAPPRMVPVSPPAVLITNSSTLTVGSGCSFSVASHAGKISQPKAKKAPVPLLPKPAISAQTYALIPIQSGMPVIPAQPVIIHSVAPSTCSPSAASTLKSMTISSKGGVVNKPRILKRQRSPRDVYSLAPLRKQVKVIPKHPAARKPKEACSFTVSVNPSPDNHSGSQLDTSEIQHQLSQIKFDSGIVSDLSECSDLPSSQEIPEIQQGLPKPKIYRHRKSKLVPRNCDSEEKNKVNSDSGSDKGNGLFSLSDSRESGIHEILASIERDMSSPMKCLLRTPTKSPKNNLLTSTPFKGILGSPSWISPIKGFTPLSGDAHVDSGFFTPDDGRLLSGSCFSSSSGSNFTKIKYSTPYNNDGSPRLKDAACFRISAEISPNRSKGGSPVKFSLELSPTVERNNPEKSPTLGSFPSLAMTGLTPLRTPNKSSGPSPDEHNHSFARFLGDIQLENFLEEGINMDFSNLSFSSLQ